jgi:hypothetical protein
MRMSEKIVLFSGRLGGGLPENGGVNKRDLRLLARNKADWACRVLIVSASSSSPLYAMRSREPFARKFVVQNLALQKMNDTGLLLAYRENLGSQMTL